MSSLGRLLPSATNSRVGAVAGESLINWDVGGPANRKSLMMRDRYPRFLSSSASPWSPGMPFRCNTETVGKLSMSTICDSTLLGIDAVGVCGSELSILHGRPTGQPACVRC
jgi:hypothetical protein